MTMQLICLSVTHHNTPVELRECLSLTDPAIQEALTKFPIRTAPFESMRELVILSTCNRLEIYAMISPAEETLQDATSNETGEALQTLLTYIRDVFGIPTTLIDPYFQQYSGIETVEHLFQVAAGLDSIAIGETQILGQVARALENGLRLGSARHVLSSLFRSAIHTGKRVRTETAVGKHPTSISSIAVQLAENTLGALANQKILVIGAGKMGGYAIHALQAHGAGQIFLTNRTLSHAEEMVGKFGGAVLPYEQLDRKIMDFDIIFTSTAAPQPILHRDQVQKVMAHRPKRPLTLIDLAVPRNVEARVKEIPQVQVFDMDDLQSFARSTLRSTHQDILHAEAIVHQEVTDYEKLLRVIPFIGELHKKIERIRQREVKKTLRHLGTFDPLVQEQIETLSRSLVQKILHEPTMHLRTESNQETLNDYVDTLSRLFDLEENDQEDRRMDKKWEQ